LKRVGFIVNSRIPAWSSLRRGMRPHHMLAGWPDKYSPMHFMRFGWIADEVNRGRDIRYELFKPWRKYDAVVFLKSMEAGCVRLAEILRGRGCRVVFEANVDYYTGAGNESLPCELVPTPAQRSAAIRMTSLADRVIASSGHLAEICRRWNPVSAWVPDNIPSRMVPSGDSGAPVREGRLQVWWSGMPAKIVDFLAIEKAMTAFRGRIHLNLVTGDISSAIGRLSPEQSARIDKFLSTIGHTFHRFQDIPRLLRLYHQGGGVILSPRLLDNPYNQSHTEWKITLGLACGLPAITSPQPSYLTVAERCRNPRTVCICNDDDAWRAAFEEALEGKNAEEKRASAREVVRQYYSTKVVASQHLKELGGALES
jgi:glycosyltransferase involved in cell wall biosynthesis